MKRLVFILAAVISLTASHPWEGKRIAYVKAIKEASEIWSVPVIDTYSLCGLLPSRKEHSRYVPGENDFLHPNEEGHHRIALCVYHQLSSLPCRLDSLE